jgi:hypothetical protein
MLKQSKIMLEEKKKATKYIRWHENLWIVERGLGG